MQVCDFDSAELAPGESHLNENCSKTECGSDFGIFTVTCGIGIRDGCKLEPDYTLKYPGTNIKI